jgi:uncharacterized alpha-E superfamily protein
MLARVAYSLYWMGRYLERTEHLARYTKVQYFTSQDAPFSQNLDFVLSSIANMAGMPIDNVEKWDEQQLLYDVILNPEQSLSLMSNLTLARENGRSMRNAISSELWLMINRYYIFARDYDPYYFKTQGLFDFTTKAEEHCALIRGYVDATLTHDETWALIRLGIHLERAAQIARIISCKMYDIFRASNGEKDGPMENYNYAILLKLLEAFDMNRKHYKATLEQRNVIEFLVFNELSPRSIHFNLHQIRYFLKRLGTENDTAAGQPKVMIKEMLSKFDKLEYKHVEDRVQAFVNETLQFIYALHAKIEDLYFRGEGA